MTELPQTTLLVVDDDASNRVLLTRLLGNQGYRVLEADSGEAGLEIARRERPTLVLLDVLMPGLDGYAVCEALRADPRTQGSAVLFLSAMSSAEDRIRGLEAGGVDYIGKPFDRREVVARVGTHAKIARLQGALRERHQTLERELAAAQALVADANDRLVGPLLGESLAIRVCRARVIDLAQREAPILICGPEGAGHEAAARQAHAASARKDGPFLRVDCYGTPTPFSPTAGGSSPWDIAARGTIFFDHVEALAPELQEELARRLSGGGSPAGCASAGRPRVIASSPLGFEALTPLAQVGTWERVELPPLAARVQDIPELVMFFLKRAAQRLGREVEGLEPASLRLLEGAPWAGNVDELQAVLDCALRTSTGSRVEVKGALLESGRRLGRYRLVEKIGSGGMGEVWKATHRLLLCPAAVKLVRTDHVQDPIQRKRALAQFELEARATASLESPHTVGLYDFGVTEAGTLYYAMELLAGMDLASLVHSCGPLPGARVLSLLAQACLSLEEAHRGGLLHRDVKPSNLFAAKVGTRFDVLKVLDFGLVFDELEPTRGEPSGALGTPAFMAPEVCRSEPTPQSDLYSLGCTAYWLLTGQRLFSAEGAEDYRRAHQEEPARAPSLNSPSPVPPALDELVLACLEKRPADRPSSAAEVRAVLREASVDWPWTQVQAEGWWSRSGELPHLTPSAGDGTTRVR